MCVCVCIKYKYIYIFFFFIILCIYFMSSLSLLLVINFKNSIFSLLMYLYYLQIYCALHSNYSICLSLIFVSL